jgi:co-chaperonin GroES (HSP10)
VAVCIAEMVAAQRFNQADGQDVVNIYGSVTTGTQWQFLKLTGQEVSIDVTEYPLMPVDNVLGILRWMLEN